MPKLSISLSERASARLHELTREHATNPSVLLETSLMAFSAFDNSGRVRAIRETQAAKKIASRSTWRSAFWSALAEQFGATDFAQGRAEYLMAPRRHLGFDVVFLLPNTESPEVGDIVVDVHEAIPWTEQTKHLGRRWGFQEGASVFESAREVATWIRANVQLLTGSEGAESTKRIERLRLIVRSLDTKAGRVVYYDGTVVVGVIREYGPDIYAIVPDQGWSWKQPIVLDLSQILIVEPAPRS